MFTMTIVFKIQGKEPREIYEAINHKNALELVIEKRICSMIDLSKI